MCRCKFDSSNKEMRDFLNDRVNCYRDFLKKQIKHFQISQAIWSRKEHQKYVREMSKYTTSVQNRVFEHYTRKELRNNSVKKTLDYIST